MPVLRQSVCQRVGFAESAAQGKTMLELEPGSQASCEIYALVDEILALAGLQPHLEKEKAA